MILLRGNTVIKITHEITLNKSWDMALYSNCLYKVSLIKILLTELQLLLEECRVAIANAKNCQVAIAIREF